MWKKRPLVDTFGVVNPHAVPYFVHKVRERIKKPVEAHFHDDYGLGVANTLMALASGVEVAHTTVTGFGERAGNAPYEEIVMALLTLYGVDTGIDTTKLRSISKLVQQIAGIKTKPNRSVIGERLFQIESGIVAGWVRNCGKEMPLEIVPYLPELVGEKSAEVCLRKTYPLDEYDF